MFFFRQIFDETADICRFGDLRLKCESLSRRDIPFAVSIETAIEYASLEHDVETSPEDWKL